MRDYFRGPALDRPAKLWPTGRRNRKLPGLILLCLLLLLPLGWLLLHDEPAAVIAEPPPPVVVPSPSPVLSSPTPTPSVTSSPTPSPSRTRKPTPTPTVKKLTQATLAPGRTVSCARVILGIDQSNSMAGYTAARDNALQQLVDWSSRNLKKRDQIAVVDFAGEAGVRQAPTSVKQLTGIGPVVSLAGGSKYLPILEAIKAFPPSSCKTALVLLSDGDLEDLPADASESGTVLRGSDVKFQRLLVPDRNITVPLRWATAFPNGKPVFVDGMNPDETARVIGETIAKIVNSKIVYH
ncbi:vWA domain-containing protein [Actinoplanes awajinensis]|uniref:VWFA domain-containing protein n=1 Tax=Actinoplanes awajinensis subsp. mycoplanecinus TaxID=135947 RepID=A0A0X3VAS9_9ACTN|nr:hypothetical protein [Actinoplanes awajinensis]KUL41362.1 hypothetical protein ADL15_03665 [Actinoplanes awajinensis subsp. mycoplanecinus]